MGFDEDRIDHHVLVFRVFDQPGKDLLPDTFLGPTAAAFMGGLPLAVAFRQIVPVGSAAKHPQHAVEKLPVIGPAAPGITHFPG